MQKHWTLQDINWAAFDSSKVDPELLRAVKAASLVEGNASDYVGYLREVFAGDAETISSIERWGTEEVQHGEALGRWAELADPAFNYVRALAAFRAGYHVPAPTAGGKSVRGSRSGEMISRCVVESGTSSYYSAMRDAAQEPVLKEIAANIAADEFRHYKLFYETLLKQNETLPFFTRFRVAASRVSEAEDDELAYAYYCGNTPATAIGTSGYDRKASVKAYTQRVARMYRKHHIKKAAQMIALAIGARPKGVLARLGSWIVWTRISAQARSP